MRPSTYLWIFGSLFLAGVAAVAALNLIVDPLGAYPGLSLRPLERYRAQMTSRQAKAELIFRGGFETVLLGSSRVLMGVPVDHPAYGKGDVCNLALNGTTLVETEGAMGLALRCNPVKRVLFGADFHMFSDARKARVAFDQSRFNPHLNLFDYHARNLMGAQATEDSWLLFEQWMRSVSPPPGSRGFAPKLLPRSTSQYELSMKRIRESLTNPGSDADFEFSAERLETFRNMVRRCLKGEIELKVFIPPTHALQLEAIRAAQLWPQFEQWKRNLVRILAEEAATDSITLLDFTGFTGYVAEGLPPAGDRTTRMNYYLETSHFTPKLGALILERLLAPAEEGQSNEFGVRLTPMNIEPHLEKQRADREIYAAAHPDEVSAVAHLAKTAKRKRVAPRE